MITTTELDTILDELSTTTDLSVMGRAMEDTQITVTGIVDITHSFGKITEFTVSLDTEDHEMIAEITDLINEDIDNGLLLDDIILYDITTDNLHWFLLPIDDGRLSTRAAIMSINAGTFDKTRWERFTVEKEKPLAEEVRGYDAGHVTSLVKMVNAGESATEIVDTMDLSVEDEDEVLSFRGN